MPAKKHDISAANFRDPLIKVLGQLTGFKAGVVVFHEKTYDPVFQMLGVTREQYGMDGASNVPLTERWVQWCVTKLIEDKEKNVARQRQEIGMVFQRFNLFPHMTALENIIEAPMLVKGMEKEAAVQRAHELLEQVGLSDRADYYPSQISGGQKQRVAIARALAMEPKVMLFDEPTSALDPELIGEVLNVMKSLAREGTTMLVVTHEMEFARDVANRVIVIHDGELVEQGAPVELFNHPQNEHTQALLERYRSGKSPQAEA